jgi:hypothetical protein
MVVEATGPSGAAATFAASAVDLVDGAVTPACTPASGSTFALGTHTFSCTATDKAGNTGDATFHVTVRDTTPPTVIVPANVTTGPTGASGANATFGSASATDLVDGNSSATCDRQSGSLFGFGATTVTCSATDSHGNTGHASFTVTVRPFTFLGFFQPVDNLPALNTVKGGATVPLKWKLQGEGNVEITDVKAVALLNAQAVNCTGLAATQENPLDLTATGGTVLRYDPTAMQFIFNWQTPKASGTCWRVDVTFTDGQPARSANFKPK